MTRWSELSKVRSVVTALVHLRHRLRSLFAVAIKERHSQPNVSIIRESHRSASLWLKKIPTPFTPDIAFKHLLRYQQDCRGQTPFGQKSINHETSSFGRGSAQIERRLGSKRLPDTPSPLSMACFLAHRLPPQAAL